MSDETMTKTKWLLIVCVWLAIIGTMTAIHRYWWTPKQKHKEEEEHQEIINKTSSHPRYEHTVNFVTDAFSGYAPFRSKNFQEECSKLSVRVNFDCDDADYSKRLKAFADGKYDMGVFTIDALIKTTAQLKDFPVTIVAIIDESKGADGIVASKKTFPNLDSLNDPNVKIVCVPDSPSETLARVVMSYFNLDSLKNPFEFVKSADEVFKSYQDSNQTDKKVFVTWEPYLSRIVNNPEYHTLINSSKFRGYILDVLVVRREYLFKHEDVVSKIVKAYLTTLYENRGELLIKMIQDDSKIFGEMLKDNQALKLRNSIWWKNAQENFAHFGFINDSGIQSMDDMCRNITNVLIQTGAISEDPTQGQTIRWYYDDLMKKLFESAWHPGVVQEGIRQEAALATLSDKEWDELKPVGTLQIPRLVFSRGTDHLTLGSESVLTDLCEKLKSFPQYYLIVRGNASSEGDLEANLKLATSRANAAVSWLTSNGVSNSRIKAESAKPNGSTTVMFILGEQPY